MRISVIILLVVLASPTRGWLFFKEDESTTTEGTATSVEFDNDKETTAGFPACNRNQFRCVSSGECISQEVVCDGTADCDHGEDERAPHCETVAPPDDSSTDIESVGVDDEDGSIDAEGSGEAGFTLPEVSVELPPSGSRENMSSGPEPQTGPVLGRVPRPTPGPTPIISPSDFPVTIATFQPTPTSRKIVFKTRYRSAAGCEDLPNISGSINDARPGPPYPNGITITYSCKRGYIPRGGNLVTCNGDQWDLFDFSCAPVTCPAVVSPDNGRVIPSTKTSYDDTVRYTCDSGYEWSGSSERTCQADGTWSGLDGECKDAAAVPGFRCEENQFRCRTVDECIPTFFKCDDSDDCSDGSDEGALVCPGVYLTSPSTRANVHTTRLRFTTMSTPEATTGATAAAGQCKFGEFPCVASRKCIKKSWVCDHFDDCEDSSDESATLCQHTEPPTADPRSPMRTPTSRRPAGQCSSLEFPCSDTGECIKNTWVCDNFDDCRDGSDESATLCENIESITPPPALFEVTTKPTTTMLPAMTTSQRTSPTTTESASPMTTTAAVTTKMTTDNGCSDLGQRRLAVAKCLTTMETTTNDTSPEACLLAMEALTDCLRPLVAGCKELEELAAEMTEVHTECNHTAANSEEEPYPHASNIITAGSRAGNTRDDGEPVDVAQHLISVRLLGDEFTLRLLRARDELEREVTAQLLAGLRDVYGTTIMMVKVKDFRPSSNHMWVDFYAYLRKDGSKPVNYDSVVRGLAGWLHTHRLGRIDADMGAIVDAGVQKDKPPEMLGKIDQNTVITMATCFAILLVFMVLLVSLLIYRNKRLRRHQADKTVGETADPGELLSFHHRKGPQESTLPTLTENPSITRHSNGTPNSSLGRQPTTFLNTPLTSSTPAGLLWHINSMYTSPFSDPYTVMGARGSLSPFQLDPNLGRIRRGSLIPRAHLTSSLSSASRISPGSPLWTSGVNGPVPDFMQW